MDLPDELRRLDDAESAALPLPLDAAYVLSSLWLPGMLARHFDEKNGPPH